MALWFRISRTERLGALAVVLFACAACPFAASASCTGEYAGMQSYAGKYIYKTYFLATPAVAARLKQLPRELRLHLQRNLDVSGPIRLIDCHLVVTGAQPHRGTEENGALDLNLTSGTVTAAIHSGGHIDIYVIRDPSAGMSGVSWQRLPQAVRAWAVMASMGFPSQPPTHLNRPDNVRLHAATGSTPPAGAALAIAHKILFNKDAVEPTPTQAAAIRQATGNDLTDCLKNQPNCYAMALADINNDGRSDLLVQYFPATGFCGSAGCAIVLIMATPNGYADKAINLATSGPELDVLHGMHHGMHDLRYNGDSPRWEWNGREYRID